MSRMSSLTLRDEEVVPSWPALSIRTGIAFALAVVVLTCWVIFGPSDS